MINIVVATKSLSQAELAHVIRILGDFLDKVDDLRLMAAWSRFLNCAEHVRNRFATMPEAVFAPGSYDGHAASHGSFAVLHGIERICPHGQGGQCIPDRHHAADQNRPLR